MNKRNKIFIIIFLVGLFLLTGCAKKTAITTEQFRSTLENNGYEIIDAKDQFEGYEHIKQATVALNKEGFQIEFYEMTDVAHATSLFNTNKEIFETFKASTKAESYKTTEQYSIYTLASSGYYMYLSRIDNTMLYIKVTDDHKSDVIDIIKKLGY